MVCKIDYSLYSLLVVSALSPLVRSNAENYRAERNCMAHETEKIAALSRCFGNFPKVTGDRRFCVASTVWKSSPLWLGCVGDVVLFPNLLAASV